MRYLLLAFLLFSISAQAQPKLTVDKMMQDPKWMGSQPSEPQWRGDGKRLYFLWNPTGKPGDSLYATDPLKPAPTRLSSQEEALLPEGNVVYPLDPKQSGFAFTAQGDLFLQNAAGQLRRLTKTEDTETARQWIGNQLIFSRSGNYFALDLNTGLVEQWVQTQRGNANKPAPPNAGQQWLQKDALALSEVLSERRRNRDSGAAYRKRLQAKPLRTIYTGEKSLFNGQFNTTGRFFTGLLRTAINDDKATQVPTYVTDNGYTQTLNSRPKVGFASTESELLLFDREKDTVLTLSFNDLPGRKTWPLFLKENGYADSILTKQYQRTINVRDLAWNPAGTRLSLELVGSDNKDRWLLSWHVDSAKPSLVNHQHDEAWIGGPGINGAGRWLNDDELLFQSEATGYSHVYVANVASRQTRALTKGNYEISNLSLSRDRQRIYYLSNATNPGDYQAFVLHLASGKTEQLTDQIGLNRLFVSPNEEWLALLHSKPAQPWELFLKRNDSKAKWAQVTNLSRSQDFQQYPWRTPEQVTFRARDGATVYARLYKPTQPHANKPAVIFVHGAGYLQNAHLGWSQYYREFMFHNLLADAGYTVLDLDYRGSAGYGRDWRTGIYRHMGGKDLTDHLDAIDFLANNHGVNAKKVGIYGGSYGGFITLMGLFTHPGKFAAGAALRPVTDWAHYNHGYTSNILNTPVWDSVAYRRSSPIYHAAGLQDPLLICHGLVDVNVHAQDVLRLSQRLIELRKENWELALYPLEDHGFVEPSSWADEYKRILKLFETHLKN